MFDEEIDSRLKPQLPPPGAAAGADGNLGPIVIAARISNLLGRLSARSWCGSFLDPRLRRLLAAHAVMLPALRTDVTFARHRRSLQRVRTIGIVPWPAHV